MGKRINKIIDIIGVESDYGASRQGADFGAKAIRSAFLNQGLRELNYSVRDKSNIRLGGSGEIGNTVGPMKKLNNINLVNEINSQLYASVKETLALGHFPLVLGGDHSLAAGSITAVSAVYGKIGLIWVDAHGDFNSAESSPSGNIHGTPLSAVTGNGPGLILPFMEEGTEYVNPRNTVIIGARSLDDEEKRRIKRAGITVFCMTEIDRLGIARVMEEAVRIASEGTAGIYLSYDLDASDPSVAKGVGTPVSGGLTYRESHYLCEYLALNANLLGFEVVELNPLCDTMNETGHFAVGLIKSLLGQTIQ